MAAVAACDFKTVVTVRFVILCIVDVCMELTFVCLLVGWLLICFAQCMFDELLVCACRLMLFVIIHHSCWICSALLSVASLLLSLW